MLSRLVIGGLVWIGLLALFVAGITRPGPARLRSSDAPAAGLAGTLNRPQAERGGEWWTWKVTRATSAHRVMVVDVEARHVAEATAIAMQIVEPVRSHGYEEILVYVRQVGGGAAESERRVQWTPGGGYVEMPLGNP